jgi:hypothetical protein
METTTGNRDTEHAQDAVPHATLAEAGTSIPLAAAESAVGFTPEVQAAVDELLRQQSHTIRTTLTAEHQQRQAQEQERLVARADEVRAADRREMITKHAA